MAKKKESNEALEELLKNENIIVADVAEEMKHCFIPYSMKTILDRALPDVRDGLKPVHRRALFSMWYDGSMPDKPYTKSAKAVGSIIGNWHCHGSTSAYEAICIMSQPWANRYPLIDFQGEKLPF